MADHRRLPSLNSSQARRRLFFLETAEAAWEKVTEALEAARNCLTDFPEFSQELSGALRRDSVSSKSDFDEGSIISEYCLFAYDMCYAGHGRWWAEIAPMYWTEIILDPVALRS